jgi:hypothetical protein
LVLCRFTPPPSEQQTPRRPNSTVKMTTNELPGKLQQMNGPSGPVRKSSKVKWWFSEHFYFIFFCILLIVVYPSVYRE